MSCDKFEDFLPSYVDGELAVEERRRMDDHLAGCPSCRDALAFYRDLETALILRRELRPSSARTAAAVSHRLDLGKKRKLLEAWTGTPALAGAGFVVLGVVLLVFRGPVMVFFNGIAETLLGLFGERFSMGLSRTLGVWNSEIGQIAGSGNEWVLLSVYAGILALVLLTGSWMVLKFVRE